MGKPTQSMRSSGAGQIRVVPCFTLLCDIVQKRRQGYPHLEHVKPSVRHIRERASKGRPLTLMFSCGNALSTSNASSLSLTWRHCAWKRAGTTGSINESRNETSVLANAATRALWSPSGPSDGNSSPVSRHFTIAKEEKINRCEPSSTRHDPPL